jgi:flagellar assembly protein FliH
MSHPFIPKEQLTAFQRWELGSFAEKTHSGAAVGDGAAARAAESTIEREAARQTGYEEGYRVGIAQAQAEIDRLRAIVAAAQSAATQVELHLADEVLDLALEVARQVLRADVKSRRDALLAVVREAMACLPQGVQGSQLALNPGDVELVRAQIGDELQVGGFRIVEDHRIEPGGCRIASPVGEVDATLATRWRRVVAALGQDHDWIDAE